MARTMFKEDKDTQIFRVIVEVTMADGKADYWSTAYGPYPMRKTANTQLTRVRTDLNHMIEKHGHTGILSYDSWIEDGDISWKRAE